MSYHKKIAELHATIGLITVLAERMSYLLHGACVKILIKRGLDEAAAEFIMRDHQLESLLSKWRGLMLLYYPDKESIITSMANTLSSAKDARNAAVHTVWSFPSEKEISGTKTRRGKTITITATQLNDTVNLVDDGVGIAAATLSAIKNDFDLSKFLTLNDIDIDSGRYKK